MWGSHPPFLPKSNVHKDKNRRVILYQKLLSRAALTNQGWYVPFCDVPKVILQTFSEEKMQTGKFAFLKGLYNELDQFPPALSKHH